MLYLRLFNRFILISLVSSGLPTQAANAATLNVVGGELVSASNVNVIGFDFYDVVFAERTCAALCDGGDESTDFDFTSPYGVQAASNAVLTEVLVDGVLGQLDTEPGFTFGCGTA